MTKQPAGPRWYVATAKRGQEKLALDALERRGFAGKVDDLGQAYLPLTLQKDPKRTNVTYAVPFIRGFVFVRFDLARPGWERIFSTWGVNGMIRCGEKPSPIPDAAVQRFRDHEVDGMIQMGLEPGALPDKDFKPGDKVRVRKGLVVTLDAIFHERIDSRRAVLLVKLIGESQRFVTADLAHLE